MEYEGGIRNNLRAWWFGKPVKNTDNKEKKFYGSIIQYELEALERSKKTVADVNNAYTSATSYISPSRVQLIKIYNQMRHDPIFRTCWQLRSNAVLNGRFSIIDKNGVEVPTSKSKFIEPDGSPKLWFYNFMRIIHESIIEGHTVGQFWPMNEIGEPSYVEKLPSQNLLTPLDIFCPDGDDLNPDKGIKYLTGRYPDFVFSTKYGDDNVGIMFSLAQYIMVKPFQEYRTHVAVFGIPPKIVKTDTADPERKKNAENAVKTNATGIVLHTQDEYISSQASQGSGDGEFIPFIEKVDSYTAYVLLFSNMLADKTYVGSAEIQDQMFNEAVTNDRLYIQRNVNACKALRVLGLLPEGQYISFDNSERLKLKDRAEFIAKMQTSVVYDNTELESLTGIKIVGTKETKETGNKKDKDVPNKSGTGNK